MAAAATPRKDRARSAGAEVIVVGRGYGLACAEGAKAAGPDDIVVFMDGDGADDPAAITALIEPIRTNTFDFVIASRAQGDREAGSMAWHQLLSGHVIGRLTGLLYGVRYTDMCAFRAIRRETLQKLGMREMTYGWNLEMQMRVARAGLRVLEVPVDYRRRIGGESKVAGNLRGSITAGFRILATFGRVAVERAGPGKRRRSECARRERPVAAMPHRIVNTRLACGLLCRVTWRCHDRHTHCRQQPQRRADSDRRRRSLDLEMNQ